MGMMAFAILAMVLAQLADVVTTLRGLKPGFREGNPVIAWAMARLGPHGWIAFKAAVAGVATLYFWWVGLWWPILGIAAITGAVAWRNHRITRG